MSDAARYALGEIEAQCRKAARGAGCAWGLSEEAGRATRWLAAHGLPGPQALVGLLSGPRNCGCGGGRGPACGLKIAANVSDRAELIAAGEVIEIEVAQPLLVVAALGQAAHLLDTAFEVEWSDGRAVCSPAGIWLEGTVPENAFVHISACEAEAPNLLSSPAPLAVEASDWMILNAYAAKTYAPATEESRARGAG